MDLLLSYVALLAIHWFGDFFLQTHWQASNKSKDNVALGRHVGVYTAVITVGSLPLIGPGWAWAAFAAVNGALHFATDYATSRWSSSLFGRWFGSSFKDDKAIHDFFVVIGADQLIHQVTLAATLWLAIVWIR